MWNGSRRILFMGIRDQSSMSERVVGLADKLD